MRSVWTSHTSVSQTSLFNQRLLKLIEQVIFLLFLCSPFAIHFSLRLIRNASDQWLLACRHAFQMPKSTKQVKPVKFEKNRMTDIMRKIYLRTKKRTSVVNFEVDEYANIIFSTTGCYPDMTLYWTLRKYGRLSYEFAENRMTNAFTETFSLPVSTQMVQWNSWL